MTNVLRELFINGLSENLSKYYSNPFATQNIANLWEDNVEQVSLESTDHFNSMRFNPRVTNVNLLLSV